MFSQLFQPPINHAVKFGDLSRLAFRQIVAVIGISLQVIEFLALRTGDQLHPPVHYNASNQAVVQVVELIDVAVVQIDIDENAIALF